MSKAVKKDVTNECVEMVFEDCVIRWKDPDTGEVIGEPTISAKCLHAYLGITKRFNTWFDEMLSMGYYNESWRTEARYSPAYTRSPSGRRRISNYALSLQMARELVLFSKVENTNQALEHLENIVWEVEQRAITKNYLTCLRVLANPTEREWFFTLAGECRGDLKSSDPFGFVTRMEKVGKLTPEQAREQRIINELIFTKDVMDKMNGARY